MSKPALADGESSSPETFIIKLENNIFEFLDERRSLLFRDPNNSAAIVETVTIPNEVKRKFILPNIY